MIELEKTFMYNGKEYRIININEKKSRINIEPIGEEIIFPEINERIEIENILFKVIYVNSGRKRITIEPIKKGA